MTIGIGYFIGGLVLIAYSALCYYVGIKRPASLFKLTKAKIGAKKKSDEFVAKFCIVWATIALVAGITVFVLGYINA